MKSWDPSPFYLCAVRFHAHAALVRRNKILGRSVRAAQRFCHQESSEARTRWRMRVERPYVGVMALRVLRDGVGRGVTVGSDSLVYP